ncbi:MAG: MIP/aquaporin family protein [Thermoleophilaceae bacterium]
MSAQGSVVELDEDAPPERGAAAYLAEFVGTFALVFFITAAVSVYVVAEGEFVDYSVIGLVHVFVLFMLIQTLAVVSGAHFNPAVTVALTALRQIQPLDAAIYVVSQLAGGIAAALVTKALFTEFPNAEAVNYGAPATTDVIGERIGLGMLAEGIGTFFLVWVIVGVAVNPRAAKEWAALAIGATLGLGVFVMAPLTGASFNPARAFGPALVSGEFGGAKDFVLVYTLAPAIGGLLAAIIYFNIFIAPGRKEPGAFGPVG